MTAADWVSVACVAGVLAALAVVAVDRNRLRHRLDNAEGRVTGLSLDLDAVTERLTELTSYLGRPESWQVGAVPPSDLSPDRPADRWTPVRHPSEPDSGPHDGARAADSDEAVTSRRHQSR